MTTFSELKTSAALELKDPGHKTFVADELASFINAAIMEVSRFAPQPFTEDVALSEGQSVYPLRGGTGNLVANPSFETAGDSDVLSGFVSVTTLTDVDALAGWQVSRTCQASFPKNVLSKTGQRVGLLLPENGDDSTYWYQTIPVNPDTVYYFSGWHWKSVTGGNANRISLNTVDTNGDIVALNVLYHDTTASTPQFYSGTYAVPDDGSVAYLQVRLTARGIAENSERYAIEDMTLVEQSERNLVPSSSQANIEVNRVELWDNVEGVARYVRRLQPARSEYENNSQSGWSVWRGQLMLPDRDVDWFDYGTNFLRVWGYAPYDKLIDDAQVTDLTDELEYAILEFVRVKALRRLVVERDLFTQWQTRSGNSDVSPAAIMNGLAQAEENWRRLKRELTVLRGTA